MKCAEIEKLVYLYDISNDKERKIVQLHITSCESCLAIWQQQQETQRLLKAHSFAPPLDEDLLVNRIMASLPHPALKKKTIFSLEDLIHSLGLKYSFAFISAFLVGVFFLEYNQDPLAGTPQSQTAKGKMITLDSNQFFTKRKETTAVYSLVACITSCKEETLRGFCNECPSFILNK